MTSLSKRMESVVAVSIIFGSISFLSLFGLLGFFRDADFGFDFMVFYTAGEHTIRGENPWTYVIGKSSPFSYPPHVLPIVAFYSMLPYKIALLLHTCFNLISICIIAYLANYWFLAIVDIKKMKIIQGLGLAIIIGNPFMAHSVFQGQLSLIAVACTFLSWHYLHNKRWALSGLFLGIATIKPQVSFFYIIWLMLSLNFRVLFIGGGASLILLIPSFLSYGILSVFDSWIQSMEYYMQRPNNQPGFRHVIGLESLLASLGVKGLGIVTKSLGILAIVALYYYRNRISAILIVSSFFVISLIFVYGHDSDFVAIALFCSYFAYVSFQTKSILCISISGVLLILLFFPQRFLGDIDWPPIYHWRTIVVLIIWYLMFRWEYESKKT